MRKLINAFIGFFYFDFLKFIPYQTFRYLACGGTTVVVDILVYFLSYQFVFKKQPVVIGDITIGAHIAAFIVAFMVSFPLGFILNKFIVFTNSALRGRVQLFRYGLTVTSCVGLNYLFLKVFVEGFHWFATPSKMLTTVIVAVYSYFTQQYFSFKVKSAGKGEMRAS